MGGDAHEEQGWTAIPGSGSVFLHGPTRAIMVVYVDDMFLVAKTKDGESIWRTLEKSVHFKVPEQPLARYPGARYKFEEFDSKKPNKARSMRTDMDDYALNAVAKFKREYDKTLHKVSHHS